MTEDSRLWRLAVVVAEAEAAAFEALLAEGAVAVSRFAAPDQGGWRVEALRPERPGRAPLEAALAAVAARRGLAPPSLEIDAVGDEDWQGAALARQPPVAAGRYRVRRGQDLAPPASGAVSLVVDAGLAFGSGLHESTRGVLLALDRLAKGRLARGRRFARPLDLGCGSGVLAMAMAGTWRRPTRAADIEPVAVAVARANVGRNGLTPLVRVLASDGLRHPGLRAGAPYDLVVANILARPLARLAPGLARHTRRGAVVVLSGLLVREAPPLLAAYRARGFRLERRLVLGEWATLVLKRR
jgi:ribosomal protein L11 methyltransferase